MQTEFQAKGEAYQKQQMILSDETRAQKEAELMQLQQELQQAMMSAEQEIQAAQARKANSLFERMRTVVETIGEEKGYDLVIEASAVMYMGKVDDITAEARDPLRRGQVGHGRPARSGGGRRLGRRNSRRRRHPRGDRHAIARRCRSG